MDDGNKVSFSESVNKEEKCDGVEQEQMQK